MTSSDNEFITDSKRDATDSIRGYVYQAYQSVLAWIDLNANEELFLEAAEDFDIHQGDDVETVQVKDVQNNLTLRSSAVIDAINNFWKNCSSNNNYKIQLRFLSTADTGQEKGSPFGKNVKGLSLWYDVANGKEELQLLKDFLLSLNLDDDLIKFLKNNSDEAVIAQLIKPIRWDLGRESINSLISIIENKLIHHGQKNSASPSISKAALSHLLLHVANLLSTKGKKKLLYSEFLLVFEEATTIRMPSNQVAALVNSSDQLAFSKISGNAVSFTGILPVVESHIPRKNITSVLEEKIKRHNLLFLSGSSGTGKTHLGSILANNLNCEWAVTSLRNKQIDSYTDIFQYATYAISNAEIQPFLILDDLDFTRVSQYENELVELLLIIKAFDGHALITGSIEPSESFLQKSNIERDAIYKVPHFTEAEVQEFLVNYGLTDKSKSKNWAKAILLSTSGHPQLVHARVRNLKSKAWPSIQDVDLIKPSDVEVVRQEARKRLISELPNEAARILAYKLSIIIGAFSKETAIAVANAPPPTRLPGEAFETLIGPWIEKEGNNKYRISPLLNGAHEGNIATNEKVEIHSAIASNILASKAIDQYQTADAFYHAYMARDISILVTLLQPVFSESMDKVYLLYDAMSWFTMMHVETGGDIIPEDKNVNAMLRIAQFKLLASSKTPEKAIKLIDIVESAIQQVENSDAVAHLSVMAYTQMLINYEVPIPPQKVIAMIKNLYDIATNYPEIDELVGINTQAKLTDDHFVNQEYKNSIQVLFSFQAVRLSNVNELLILLESIDLLEERYKSTLVETFDIDDEFSNALVSGAWQNSIKQADADFNDVISSLEKCIDISKKWGACNLTVSCYISVSVTYDEYLNDQKLADKTLDTVEIEFPDNARLINQRAKVCFSKDNDIKGALLAEKAVKLKGLSDIDKIFSCRNAGIAFANSDNWKKAEELFQQGKDLAEKTESMTAMSVGFIADIAFAQWKQKNFTDSIINYAKALENVVNFNPEDNIKLWHLHATLRHSVSWIHFNGSGNIRTDMAEPIPGMCSNQEPHKLITEHRLVAISGVWSLLAQTEKDLGLSVGIQEQLNNIPSESKPAIIEGYERTQNLAGLYKSNDYQKLIPYFIKMQEGLEHSKLLKNSPRDEWQTGGIPTLSPEYWSDDENLSWLYQLILAACLNCLANGTDYKGFLSQWRSDIAQSDITMENLAPFLDILSLQNSTNNTYYEVAANNLLSLAKPLSPKDLCITTFRLFDSLKSQSDFVNSSFDKIIIPRWTIAIQQQRFAFITPNLICPEIAKIISNDKYTGMAKAALIVKRAAPSLSIKLNKNVTDLIDNFIQSKGSQT